MRKAVFWLVTLASLSPVQIAAQDGDAHQLYEAACAQCHAAHAGDFVFESLKMTGGTLVGATNDVPVERMLAKGHGRVSAAEAALLVQHFETIHQGGQLFQNKCYVCHQRAVLLSQLELVSRDGTLIGRYSGRDIESFLAEHGRLTPEEIPVIINRLTTNLPPENTQ